MLPSPMPITILDSVSEPAGTPLWASIVSWVVAIICAFISSGRSRKNRKTEQQQRKEEFEAFKKEVSTQITDKLNNNFFHETKAQIIDKLQHCLDQIIEYGSTGPETLRQLQNAMVQARRMAEIRKFCSKDFKFISEFENLVNSADDLKTDEIKWNIFAQKTQEVIIIFKKGEYQS